MKSIDHSVQYSGVQLLRDQQWIETLDVRDFVPKERLKWLGRGFAEFERQLERDSIEEVQRNRSMRASTDNMQ